MSSNYELTICNISSAEFDPDTNASLVRATVDVTGEVGDDEHFGDLPVFGTLGVTSVPAPINDQGRAEGLMVRGLEGLDGAILGGRDVRSTRVYAALQPGDTALHATDAAASAQFQAKANRQAVIATKDSSGNTMTCALDGKNNKVQIAAFGALFEIDKAKDRVFICTPGGGASIVMSGSVISLVGTVVLGGAIPFAPVHSGAGVGTTSIPSPGVFIGA